MNSAEHLFGRWLRLEFLGEPRDHSSKGLPFALGFLRRGIMGTLLGGFFIDPHLSLWHNTLHLYMFLALCLVPFTCVMIFGKDGQLSNIGYGLYILFSVLTVPMIKIANHWLHANIDPPPPVDETTPGVTVQPQRPVHMQDNEGIRAGQDVAYDGESMRDSAEMTTLEGGANSSNMGATTSASNTVEAGQSKPQDRGAGVTNIDDAATNSRNSIETAASGPDIRPKTVHSYIDETGNVQYYMFEDPEGDKSSVSSTLSEETASQHQQSPERRQEQQQQQQLTQPEPTAIAAESAAVDGPADSNLPAETLTSLSANEAQAPQVLPGQAPASSGSRSSLSREAVTSVTITIGTTTITSTDMLTGKTSDKPKNNKDNKEPTRPFREVVAEWFSLFNSKLRSLFPEQIHRKDLEDLFDRTQKIQEVGASIFFTLCVTLIGYRIYAFYDFTTPIFFYSIVLGSAHYSLLKSPQPDAASPQHDNTLTAYTRSLYVTILASSILVINACAATPQAQQLKVFYGVAFYFSEILSVVQTVLLILIICLPVMHLLAVLPQITTLINHVLEQWLMLVMGTTATQSIADAVVELIKSIVLLLPAFFAAVGLFSTTAPAMDVTNTPLFALYAALLMSAGYFLAATEKFRPEYWLHLMYGIAMLTGALQQLWPSDSKSLLGHVRQVIFDQSRQSSPSVSWFLYDCMASLAIIVFVFVIHLSGVFSYRAVRLSLSLLVIYMRDQRDIMRQTMIVFAVLGLVSSLLSQLIIPQMRRPHAFGFITTPILKAKEYGQYEVSARTQLMWVEVAVVFMQRLQSFLFYPVVTICLMTTSAEYLRHQFGPWLGAFTLTMAAGKLARLSFSDLATYAYALLFGLMFSNYELAVVSESVVLDTFLISVVVPKIKEALLKLSFHLVYTAPWNLLWGSSFHVFMHPFALPHTLAMFFQILVSSLVSAPYYPIGGSSAFLMSYMRPVRFWERHYNTKRIKDDNQRLADSLDRSTASTLNNLNSIFYEHLAKTLSQTLYDDVQLGRYGGDIENGDMFILISDKLTAVLHIIQLGNGFVTFQLRGLEFKGTYCQERELEAISEDPADSDHRVCLAFDDVFSGMFKPLVWWSMRWRTWELLNQTTVLQTYSISLNPAASMFYAHSLRPFVVKFFVMCALYYLIESPQLESWLSSTDLLEPLMELPSNFVARGSLFTKVNNIDYDAKRNGVSMSSFQKTYSNWIKTCVRYRKRRTRKALKIVPHPQNLSSTMSTGSGDSFPVDESGGASADSGSKASLDPPLPAVDKDTDRVPYFLSSADPRTATFAPRLLRLCFSLSLVARRALLSSTAETGYMPAGDSLLYMFYQLFRGDVRITAAQDEWIFTDFSLLEIIKRAIRMTLRLHQDYVSAFEEYTDLDELYAVLDEYSKTVVICHEGDNEWTDAVMADRTQLLSMRKAIDDKNQTEEHYIVMLNMKYSKFRTIKINRESVRGFWAAQQHELIFFGNENSERGSIQQMRPAIRNLVTQACDLPVGYPIFISPLTTSYTQNPSPFHISWWLTELRKLFR